MKSSFTATISKVIVMKFPKLLPKQIETGTTLGGLITLIQRCQFYFSILNFLMILATFYYTTLKHVCPFIPFWVFVLTMAGLLLALMVLEYTIIYPSFVAFQAHQAYRKERNPIVRDMENIKRELEEIKKILEEMKKETEWR